MDDIWELEARWYGPLDFERVRDEAFTPGMLAGFAGLYVWGAERGEDFQVLYVGQSEDPVERQRDHMRGTLGKNLARHRELRWTPRFWTAALACKEFCAPRVSARTLKEALDLAEKALIYKTSPKWNRSNSGYVELHRPVRLESSGRRPDGVPRVIRLNRGHHS